MINFINKIKRKMSIASVVINNQNYVGHNVIINGNKITIDGVDVTPDSKEITITINGNIDNLNVDYCKEIHVVEGDVNTLTTTSGDVYCNNIGGNTKTTSGDIQCQNICGDVQTTSGDISVGLISGSVKTISGDVRYKK